MEMCIFLKHCWRCASQAHNPSFLVWSQSPNCSTSQADSSRAEASSASGVVPRRSLLSMHPLPLLILVFWGVPESIKSRMMKNGEECWPNDSWSTFTHFLGMILGGFGPPFSPSSHHFPHQVSHHQPLTTQVVTINVHPPAWRFPWWLSQLFRQPRVKKYMNQLRLICPVPVNRSKV